MARFKENDLPKSKITASSLQKATVIFQYTGNHRWKFYVGLIFLLFTGATALAFPKLMGMLIDCVKNKDNSQANMIQGGQIIRPEQQSHWQLFHNVDEHQDKRGDDGMFNRKHIDFEKSGGHALPQCA